MLTALGGVGITRRVQTRKEHLRPTDSAASLCSQWWTENPPANSACSSMWLGLVSPTQDENFTKSTHLRVLSKISFEILSPNGDSIGTHLEKILGVFFEV